MMWKLKGWMDKGEHYDVEIKTVDGKGGIMMCKLRGGCKSAIMMCNLKRWMDK